MRYVSLHHHSTFSYLDGYGTPEQHVQRAVDLGMGALFLTEHGNVSSHVRLEKACQAAGIKAGFGVELYTGGIDEENKSKFKWHLTVLAENAVGYRNLLRLVSRGWSEGFYYEPTVSAELLAEHKEGLVVLSGCSGSKAVCDLLGGKGVDPHEADIAAATRTIRRFKSLLGSSFYLEAQAFPELERSRLTNQAWEEISKRTGVPIVATGDVHYPRPEDSDMQVILHSVGRGGAKNSFEQQAQSWGYDVKLAPPLTDAAVVDRLVGTGMTRRGAVAAVNNAALVADRCNVTLPKVDRLRYPVPAGGTSEELIWNWLRRGWKYRAARNPEMRRKKWEYVARLKYEMELITEKDFIDYFLLLSDLVTRVKDEGIPVGPARGSAAASLACYLLRITEIDPMPFPIMLFERFIDINRHDLPDVDLDFDDEKRDRVTEICQELYGIDRVGTIGSFTRYRGKNAIDDVARVFRIPETKIGVVKDLIVERSGGDARFDASIEDTLEMFPQARQAFDDNPDLYRSLALEGNIRGMGMHAAGLVVANAPLTDYVAVYSREDSKGRQREVVSVDKYDAEHLGVLKIDALGLSTMGMIRHALEIIGMQLEDLYAIPLDDPAVIEAFRRNDVSGVFQFDGRATKSVNNEVKPDDFLEIADVNALSRPGPLHSGTAGDYIAVKMGQKKAEHLHPIVDKITSHTKGQIIYQEQILQLVREVGKFPWTHAAAIRKIISQKKGEAAFNEMWERFRDGAGSQDISEETAAKVWRRLVTAGTYAFNSAHSVSYSMLAFWTMWLKVHHPVAFYTACFRKYSDDPKANKVLTIQRDAVINHGLKVYPPDLDTAGVDWMPAPDGVMAGYSQVPGIGEKLAARIIQDREENGRYGSWANLERVNGFGPAKMKAVLEFVNSPDPFGITTLVDGLNAIRDAIRAHEIQLPTPTHTAADLPYGNVGGAIDVVWLGQPNRRNLRDLFEFHRSRTGDELDPEKVRRPDLRESMTVYCEDDEDFVNLSIDRFKYPHFRKALWDLKLGKSFVLVRGRKVASFGRTIHVERLWVINPEEG